MAERTSFHARMRSTESNGSSLLFAPISLNTPQCPALRANGEHVVSEVPDSEGERRASVSPIPDFPTIFATHVSDTFPKRNLDSLIRQEEQKRKTRWLNFGSSSVSAMPPQLHSLTPEEKVAAPVWAVKGSLMPLSRGTMGMLLLLSLAGVVVSWAAEDVYGAWKEAGKGRGTLRRCVVEAEHLFDVAVRELEVALPPLLTAREELLADVFAPLLRGTGGSLLRSTLEEDTAVVKGNAEAPRPEKPLQEAALKKQNDIFTKDGVEAQEENTFSPLLISEGGAEVALSVLYHFEVLCRANDLVRQWHPPSWSISDGLWKAAGWILQLTLRTGKKKEESAEAPRGASVQKRFTLNRQVEQAASVACHRLFASQSAEATTTQIIHLIYGNSAPLGNGAVVGVRLRLWHTALERLMLLVPPSKEALSRRLFPRRRVEGISQSGTSPFTNAWLEDLSQRRPPSDLLSSWSRITKRSATLDEMHAAAALMSEANVYDHQNSHKAEYMTFNTSLTHPASDFFASIGLWSLLKTTIGPLLFCIASLQLLRGLIPKKNATT